MNLLPDNFREAAASFDEAKEALIYKLAWARAVLKAPSGRYSEPDLEQLRSMVKSIEERFPHLRQEL